MFNFDNIDRYLLGSDKLFKELSNAAKLAGSATYPPYNVVKLDDNHYLLEMAVAGFSKQNLDIEIKDKTLTIKGSATLGDLVPENVTYLWKGIADRSFTRTFTLADTIEIKDAELVNGMLKIFLENLVPEEQKPKKVDIK